MGQDINVKIETLEIEKKRISLVFDSDDEQKDESISTDDNEGLSQASDVNVNNTESFGTLGDILKAKFDKMNK